MKPCLAQTQHLYYLTKKIKSFHTVVLRQWTTRSMPHLNVDAIHLASLVLKMCCCLRWWSSVDAQQLQSSLGRIFAGVVDVLAVVPEAGLDILTVYCDHTAPGRTTACDNESVHGTRLLFGNLPRRSETIWKLGARTPWLRQKSAIMLVLWSTMCW